MNMSQACWGKTDTLSNLLQDLQSLAATYALPADVAHDVLANASMPLYSVTPQADLQGMPPSPCSLPQSTALTNPAYVAAVQTCASRKNGTCCVSYPDLDPAVVSLGAAILCMLSASAGFSAAYLPVIGTKLCNKREYEIQDMLSVHTVPSRCRCYAGDNCTVCTLTLAELTQCFWCAGQYTAANTGDHLQQHNI